MPECGREVLIMRRPWPTGGCCPKGRKKFLCRDINRCLQSVSLLVDQPPSLEYNRHSLMLVPVAARSKAYVCGRWLAEIVGSNPTGAWIFVCCDCCVLSGRGLCDELITHSEESFRLCCVVVCDLETSRIGAPYIYDISSLRVRA